MSEPPKFEVIDRRKYKAEEEERAKVESASAAPPASEPPPPSASAPDPPPPQQEVKSLHHHHGPQLVPEPHHHEPEHEDHQEGDPELPPGPTAEESREQKTAYDASARRLEDLIRAQNPAMGAQPPVTFEHLVQQFYLSAMIQMGAGTQEGQRPRVDILGARQTIDLLGVLAEKTKGNLTEHEDRMLDTVLFEVRMAFLELTNMITLQGVQAPPPPPPTKK
jgi:hypothetical protein